MYHIISISFILKFIKNIFLRQKYLKVKITNQILQLISNFKVGSLTTNNVLLNLTNQALKFLCIAYILYLFLWSYNEKINGIITYD